MDKNSRGSDRVRVGKKLELRDREGRTSKKSFLETDKFRGIGRNEMSEVVSMGTEAAYIPLEKRHN